MKLPNVSLDTLHFSSTGWVLRSNMKIQILMLYAHHSPVAMPRDEGLDIVSTPFWFHRNCKRTHSDKTSFQSVIILLSLYIESEMEQYTEPVISVYCAVVDRNTKLTLRYSPTVLILQWRVFTTWPVSPKQHIIIDVGMAKHPKVWKQGGDSLMQVSIQPCYIFIPSSPSLY